MKNPLRNLLFFSPQAQRGLLLLCLAIVAFACLVPVYEHRAQRAAQPAAVPGEAYQDFRAALQQEATAGQPDTDLHANSLPGASLPEPVLRPFPFDPNRADSATLRRLGLPERTTQHIVRYRDKGGRFRQAEDFRRIYGLTDEQYAALRPFLRLTPADTLHPRVQPLWADNPGDNMPEPGKYPAGTVVDLNRADTSELKRIPGIGSAIARRIASYRQQLGGYHDLGQLKEINLDHERLRPWFYVDTAAICRINLNTASLGALSRHPYLNFYQAKAIWEYRQKNGSLDKLHALALFDEFNEADLRRLAPYVCFD